MGAEVIFFANPYTYNFIKGLTHSALTTYVVFYLILLSILAEVKVKGFKLLFGISVQIYSFPSCQLSRSLGELPGRVYQLCFHRSLCFFDKNVVWFSIWCFSLWTSSNPCREGEGKLAAAVGDGTARVWQLPGLENKYVNIYKYIYINMNKYKYVKINQ